MYVYRSILTKVHTSPSQEKLPREEILVHDLQGWLATSHTSAANTIKNGQGYLNAIKHAIYSHVHFRDLKREVCEKKINLIKLKVIQFFFFFFLQASSSMKKGGLVSKFKGHLPFPPVVTFMTND